MRLFAAKIFFSFMPKIAKVVVEIALDREFDYQVPEALSATVRLGSRVHVPFGHSTARGYVVGFADHSDRHDLKAIAALISPKPLIPLLSLFPRTFPAQGR